MAGEFSDTSMSYPTAGRPVHGTSLSALRTVPGAFGWLRGSAPYLHIDHAVATIQASVTSSPSRCVRPWPRSNVDATRNMAETTPHAIDRRAHRSAPARRKVGVASRGVAASEA